MRASERGRPGARAGGGPGGGPAGAIRQLARGHGPRARRGTRVGVPVDRRASGRARVGRGGEDGPGRSEGAKGEGRSAHACRRMVYPETSARGPRCMVGAVAGGGPWAGPPDPSLSVAALAGRRRTPMPPGWVARQLALCHGPSRPCTLPASPRTEDQTTRGTPRGLMWVAHRVRGIRPWWPTPIVGCPPGQRLGALQCVRDARAPKRCRRVYVGVMKAKAKTPPRGKAAAGAPTHPSLPGRPPLCGWWRCGLPHSRDPRLRNGGGRPPQRCLRSPGLNVPGRGVGPLG